MVDVGAKEETRRQAEAACSVRVSREAADLMRRGELKKGDPLVAARIAGIMAAKKTHHLLPLCHPLLLDHIDVDCHLEGNQVEIKTTVIFLGRTGLEMEALTAAAVAALTIYDMCKSVSRGIVIEKLRLIKKTGGKSGTYIATAR